MHHMVCEVPHLFSLLSLTVQPGQHLTPVRVHLKGAVVAKLQPVATVNEP